MNTKVMWKTLISSILLLVYIVEGYAQFPTEVKPLLTSEWGQAYPYNRRCPTIVRDSVRLHVYAGCGPLVMSQVMRYFSAPKNRYNWSLMPDVLSDTSAYAKQDVVARLIRDCGNSAGTNYATTASSTKLNGVVVGLKQTFGYSPYMHIVDRSSYSGVKGEKAWRELIYGELKNGRPVIMRGEKGPRAAHVFIIDGCKDSLVHINFGWSGKRNGFYRLDDPYGYSKNQRIVVGITNSANSPIYRRITVDQPGRLSTYIKEDDWTTLHHLKLIGTLNAADIKLLRQMAGGGKKGERNGNLSTLDMSETVVKSLPDSAFYSCYNLTYIALPITLPVLSKSALSMCTKLNSVQMPVLLYEIRYAAFAGCFNLISVNMPRSLQTIGAYAFKSCNALTSIALPPNVTAIGKGAFSYCQRLSYFSVHKNAKSIANDVVVGSKVKKIVRL